MKVIGKTDSREYICMIKHDEIEKFLGLYYGKLKSVGIGDNIDLGKGYDFHYEIIQALKENKNFLDRHIKIINTITEGFNLLGCMATKEG